MADSLPRDTSDNTGALEDAPDTADDGSMDADPGRTDDAAAVLLSSVLLGLAGLTAGYLLAPALARLARAYYLGHMMDSSPLVDAVRWYSLPPGHRYILALALALALPALYLVYRAVRTGRNRA